MFLRQALVLASITLALAVTLAVPGRTAPETLACTDGTATGTWINPKDGEPGYAAGKLLVDGSETHVFEADLVAVAPSCLYCIEGLIEGKLTDLATDTTYRVSGSYEGLAFSGAGTFHMDVTTPITDVWIGEINGTFAHKPGKAYGALDGTFTLCP